MHFTRGWPSSVPSDLKPFHLRREELTVEEDCLLWGVRVVLPAKLRPQNLSDLHRDHGGIVRMKAMARRCMWWPGMDTDIEPVAKSCVLCKVVKSAPQEAPLLLLGCGQLNRGSAYTWILQNCSRARCSF